MLVLFLSLTQPVLYILVGFKATWLREKTKVMVFVLDNACKLVPVETLFSKLSTNRNLDVKRIKCYQNCKRKSNNELGFSLVNKKKKKKQKKQINFKTK